MIWVFVVILLCIAVGVYLSRSEDISSCDSKIRFFLKEATYIYRVSRLLLQKYMRERGKRDKLLEDFRILAPDDTEKHIRNYRIRKIQLILLACAACCGLGMMLCIKNAVSDKSAALSLERNAFGEGDARYELMTNVQNESGEIIRRPLTVEIKEMTYSAQDKRRFIEEAENQIEGLIVGENEDLMHVRTNLNLIRSIPDNPVSISWISQNYEMINSKGEIKARDVPKEGIVVVLEATFSIEDEKESYAFPVLLLPPLLSYEERIVQTIREEIKSRSEEGYLEESIELPDTIVQDGERLTVAYEYTSVNPAVYLLVIAIILVLAIVYGKDKDLHDQVKKRNREMGRQYPELVSQLVLLIGAGMTIRGAITKVAGRYEAWKKGSVRGKKAPGKAAYEELVRVCHEMDSGISEQQAYINFGKRCEDTHYVRLSMLLAQNLSKGNGALSSQLSQEAAEAFDERKRSARQFGEEASTKLLGPMMLMLVIVMIIIMVPAFFSFGK